MPNPLMRLLFGEGRDLPDIDTLRMLARRLRREKADPARAAAIAAALPEMWFPFKGYYAPSQYYSWAHPGIDWPIPTSTPLYAAFGGQVVQAGSYSTLKGYAYRVTVVQSGIGFTYGHMLPNGIDVRVGQWVVPKQYLGRSDNTGNSTGPHLHMGVFDNGSGGDYGGGNFNFYSRLKRWSDAPTPPPPEPPQTGVLWYVAKSSPLSVYQAANKSSAVINHLQPGQRFRGTRNGEWIAISTGGWVMRKNGTKVLCKKV